jgi:adenosylcobyric acid synthase
MFGTLALLSAEDQALVAGWVINKFSGERNLLAPGLDALERAEAIPCLAMRSTTAW